ncbi:hypothetical protein I7I48_04671 [Histoplasma ohiense]|nr:hypothetical protein I7I48_04671 [Histoplasma ohiense (nom. inval.)]
MKREGEKENIHRVGINETVTICSWKLKRQPFWFLLWQASRSVFRSFVYVKICYGCYCPFSFRKVHSSIYER